MDARIKQAVALQGGLLTTPQIRALGVEGRELARMLRQGVLRTVRRGVFTTAEHWDDPRRADLPPMFGWLNTQLPYDPATLGLATHVHTREPGVVPLVEPDPGAGHPLVREHRDGMTWHRVAEINATLNGDRS